MFGILNIRRKMYLNGYVQKCILTKKGLILIMYKSE